MGVKDAGRWQITALETCKDTEELVSVVSAKILKSHDHIVI